MLQATIKIPYEESLINAFKAEEKEFPNKRAKYKIESDKKIIKFTAEAKDSVALRSVLTAITKILSIHEKIDQVIKNTE
ncbi:CTAG/PCC1 family protein [Candidatus Woesearchaeota archaeon]|nr:CTAG/PCC1 family protein [Candidatus Woesearchaeota archaeon]MCF7901337.1 CTAG/PCC1 family protein [Candidatus Woesearchaeota archaeon]MCF8014034.1 CTAG/PCC1 family protein [Candidatus Woesearchaeota archaeon]